MLHSLRTANPLDPPRTGPSTSCAVPRLAPTAMRLRPTEKSTVARAPDTGPDADEPLRAAGLARRRAPGKRGEWGLPRATRQKRRAKGRRARNRSGTARAKRCLDTGCCAPPRCRRSRRGRGSASRPVSSPPRLDRTVAGCPGRRRIGVLEARRRSTSLRPAPRRRGARPPAAGRMQSQCGPARVAGSHPGLGGAGVRGRLQARFRDAGFRGLDGSYARAVRANRETGGARVPEPSRTNRADAARALATPR